jgi:hypothetical protein
MVEAGTRLLPLIELNAARIDAGGDEHPINF